MCGPQVLDSPRTSYLKGTHFFPVISPVEENMITTVTQKHWDLPKTPF